ncbi:hypothetical protein GTQ40_07475 [Flavobacteriaceae bacterium R38]|nr:hypothetical protein [Flavobacteriaceae bacterium R38]
MEKAQKSKIEAIYPLTNMQQSLLFHHLMNKEDQGFLHVQCKLEGELNVTAFKDAWQAVVKRHTVMRTSVHWKNVDKPIQVVRPEKIMNWFHHDWQDIPNDKIEEQLAIFKNNPDEKDIAFEKGPLSKINLIKTDAKTHYIIWNCHHLLLDGWSCSILLQDVFAFYESFCNNSNNTLEVVPSYKTYLNWLQKTDINKASTFWKEAFHNFKTPPLFNPKQQQLSNSYLNHHMLIDEQLTTALQKTSREYRITINSLFQGVWSILLSHFFGTKDITFGNTVSGRSANFPNIDLMTGMFMNVLPVRKVLNESDALSELFQDMQSQQMEARNYEHFSGDEITSWIDWPIGIPLFDNLLIFENFPWNDINSAGIKVKEFESGITTTYPVTLTVKANENAFDVNLIVNSAIVSDETASWLLNNLKQIITVISNTQNISLHELYNQLDTFSGKKEVAFTIEAAKPVNSEKEYVGPRNDTELQLVKIWESIFISEAISVNDNFFELGGKSLQAVKMFALIKSRFNVKLPPSTLIEHPTIAEMGKIINGDKETSSWNYLVPIRAKGEKAPLFCIHAGGGHVFFYNPLLKHVDKDRPIYAIQPSGTYSKTHMHTNIKEMAKDYIEEIRLIQPNGIFNIVVYCFSTAVGLEMAIQMKKLGLKANLIVADSLAMQEDLNTSARSKMRVIGFTKRFLKNPYRSLQIMISDRINRKIKPRFIKLLGSGHDKTIARLKINLFNLYNDYDWKPFQGKISLILTQKSDKRINEEFIESWEKLAKKGLNISYTEGGNHRTLFDDTDVRFIAEKIEATIIEENK